MKFSKKGWESDQLLDIYKSLLKPRMIEEKMLNLLRQGRISKWFSGIGQEAIAVGSTLPLDSDEYIMPLHRNLGVFTSRGIPFKKLFFQWQGKKDGFTKGRDRSFHFGVNEYHICGMISHLGPQMSVSDGVALAHKLSGEKKVSLAYCGDGGTSEGEFHEAINTAAVWGLPVIFMIENNGYGLSTPISEQFVCENLADKAIGYGMKGVIVDGNNVLEVYREVEKAREYCIREQKPVFIEAKTFRMRGHEEASGTKYVPQHLFDEWAKKDPITNYENFLLKEGILTEEMIKDIRQIYHDEIDEGIHAAFEAPDIVADLEEEMADVYAPFSSQTTSNNGQSKSEKKFIQAISDGLEESMKKHDNLVLMGQDIAEYGGAFKVTQGFVDKFGKERVRNTPLCESAIVGIGLGLSLKGYKAMVEMQFADFVSVGFNQIINNLAKTHYRWGQNADVVIRMPAGGGVGAGPFHSQTNEAWFTHTPGLKVVYPSSPEDAKGLLISAIEDPNPVMFFEHKGLYRRISGLVPDGYYTIELGKAARVKDGNDVSIISYGMGVHWALDYSESHPDISVDIIDLRTLLPLDYEAIRESVAKTGKAVVLSEATHTGGFGGEIAAWISENCFELLDAPVMRCSSLDTPIPFSTILEKQFLASHRLKDIVDKILKY